MVGASVRILTRRTIEIETKILSVLKYASGTGIRDWVVRCMVFCCTASEREVGL